MNGGRPASSVSSRAPRPRSRALRRLAAGLSTLTIAAMSTAAVAPTTAHATEARLTPFGWGSDHWGELGDGGGADYRRSPVVSAVGPVSVVSMAAGQSHTLALTDDGKILAWGSPENGQLGTGWYGGNSTPVYVTGFGGCGTGSTGSTGGLVLGGGLLGVPGTCTTLGGAVAVAAGRYHSLALRGDGKVYAWGANANHQLGTASTTAVASPVPVNLPTGLYVRSIAASWSNSLAVTYDGQVWVWGATGTAPATEPTQLSMPDGLTVRSAALGSSHALLLGSDGHVYRWDGSTVTHLSMLDDTDVRAVGAGTQFDAVLAADGRVLTWGSNYDAELGNNQPGVDSATPVEAAFPEGTTVTAIAVNSFHTVALTSTGQVFTWGDAGATQLNAPTAVALPTGAVAHVVAAGEDDSFTLADGFMPFATNVSVSLSKYTIRKGDTATATAYGTYSDGTTQPVTNGVVWSSSDTSVATVTSDGAVRGVGVGSSTITATVGSLSGKATLTVTPPTLTGLTVTPNPSTAQLGGTAQYAATATYSDGSSIDATGGTAWSTSDSSVATVSSTGRATALKIGTTTITASFGGTIATSAFTVTKAATGVTVATATRATGLLQTTVTYAATLRSTVTGAPLPGEPVVFSAGGKAQCSANTSTSGVATCSVTYNLFGGLLSLVGLGTAAPAKGSTYTATFAGDENYLSSQGTGTVG